MVLTVTNWWFVHAERKLSGLVLLEIQGPIYGLFFSDSSWAPHSLKSIDFQQNPLIVTKLPKKKNRLVKLLVSPSPSSKQNGGGLSSGSSLSNASSSISTISRSATGTKYHDLIGGFQNGGQKDDDAKSDFDESPSTTTTESTTTENTKNTENSDSTIKDKQSRLERLSTASKTQSSKTRSAKSSSTSSSGTTYSSSSSSTSFESSSSNHSSDTSTSSKSSSSAESKLSKNIYLSTSMSGGNVIDAKQFYSSDNGEIYSSDTNYLRHNLTKRRFRWFYHFKILQVKF